MNRREIQQIKTFYEQERQALYQYSLSHTRNPAAAEDLVQQTFLKIMQNGGLPKAIKPYVFRALRNSAIDLARAKKRKPEVRIDLDALSSSDSDQSMNDALVQALNALDTHEREVIVLKVLDGLTFKEISEVLDTPMGTVTSRHRRGLEKLKTTLDKDHT